MNPKIKKLKKIEKRLVKYEKMKGNWKDYINRINNWIKKEKSNRKKIINTMDDDELLLYGDVMGLLDNPNFKR